MKAGAALASEKRFLPSVLFAVLLTISSCSNQPAPFRAADGEQYRYTNATSTKQVTIEVFPSKLTSQTYGVKIGPDDMEIVGTQPISYDADMFRYAKLIAIPPDYKSRNAWRDQGSECRRKSDQSRSTRSLISCNAGGIGLRVVYDDRRGIVEITPICADCIPETVYLRSKLGLAHRG